MPITDLLLTGVNLMFLGMGIVFTFLVMLVFAMLGMSRLAMASEKRQAQERPDIQPMSTVDSFSGVRGDLVAVISAAVARYRTTHN